jgi:IrrE N-terminal-like domain
MPNRFEKLAYSLREELGIPDDMILDPIDVLRRLKIAGKISEFRVVGDDDLAPNEAQWVSATREILLTKSLHKRAEVGDSAARFTVLHEVGHFSCGHATRNRRVSGAMQFGRYAEADEIEADEFARAFGMPIQLIKRVAATDVSALVAYFGIPREAAEPRLVEVEKAVKSCADMGSKSSDNKSNDPESEGFDSYEEAINLMMKNAVSYNS